MVVSFEATPAGAPPRPDPISVDPADVQQELDADSILEILLTNATMLLSLLRDEQGIPLRHIRRNDVEHALNILGLPENFVQAAGNLIQQSFRNCDLTHRQLASFMRYGRAPGNSLNLPPKERGTGHRGGRKLHENVLGAYIREHGKPNSNRKSPSSFAAARLAARAEVDATSPASAPGAASTSPASVPSAVANRVPDGRLTSKSEPLLPTRKRNAGRQRGDLAPLSPPGGAPSRRPIPSFSFGRAARFDNDPLLQAALPAKAERQRRVFGDAASKAPALGGEAQSLMLSFQKQWREGKSKMTDLISRLDRDGDGELQRDELRRALLTVATDADGDEESSEPSREAIDQVLSVFDRDGSGSIDAHELKRALCGTHQLLRKKMRAGGAGEFDVSAANRASLRQSIDAVSDIGVRLLEPAGEVPSDRDKLREDLRELLVRHSGRIVELYQFQGDVVLSKAEFVAAVSNLFGLHAADVGPAGARALQGAVGEVFGEWDLVGFGLCLTEINKILHKGGRLGFARRVRSDAIFLHEVRAPPPPQEVSPRTKHRKQKDKAQILSEARQALHGFVIQSREDQLRKRAERVAPVQLEALLHTMSASTNGVLDLFLKWDVDGDGSVSTVEFAHAISKLGFKFSKEVCEELFAFFDKDDSGSVTLEEMEATLKWGKEKKHVRPLLAGWRQLSLDVDNSVPLHEQMRIKLSQQGKHPRDMFKGWDESGDGSLDKEELGELMSALGGMDLSAPELDKLFASFDVDASGTITFKELTTKLRKEVPIEQLMNALAEPEANGTLAKLFKSKWDANGDGLLDIDEFREVLKELGVNLPDGDTTLRDLFGMLDEDGSGSISIRELQNSLRWVRSCEKCMELRNEAFSFDGTLSIQAQVRRALAVNSVRVMDLFREFDENGDGVLSQQEFTRAMPLLGIHAPKKEVEELYHSIDTDRDGYITFRELNRVLRKENDRIAMDELKDPFGRVVESNWRPPSPVVAVVDVGKLRNNVKTEHKLRGLENVQLKMREPPKAKVAGDGDANAGGSRRSSRRPSRDR